MSIKKLAVIAVLSTAVLFLGSFNPVKAMDISGLLSQIQEQIQSLLEQTAALTATTQYGVYNANTTCTDSDGGQNYGVKGGVRVPLGSYSDNCDATGHYLTEYYCGPMQGQVLSTRYYCANGCLNGACQTSAAVTPTTRPCTDSDGGKDYNVKGTASGPNGDWPDVCAGNILTEYYCGTQVASEKYNCPGGCANGACINTANPTLTVVFPNNTETLTQGTPYTLRWTGADSSSLINLSITSPTNTIAIASNIPNTGSYSWTVPTSISGSGLQLYITSGALYDRSDSTFSIIPANAPNTLTVSCSAFPSSVEVGKPAVFTPSASGGAGSYTYSWSGVCAGAGSTCTKTFSAPGTSGTTVTVTSGTQTASANCPISITAATTIPNCTDSDGGLNYNVKGTVNNNSTDYCFSNGSGMLHEYTCDAAYPGGAKDYPCPYGCKDGACIATAPVEPVLSAICSASTSSVFVSDSVIFTVKPSGGTSADLYPGTKSYLYTWSGACSGNGNRPTCSESFSTPGAQTVPITITSGRQTVSVNCSVDVKPVCAETDSGKDYNVKGTVTTRNGSTTDSCNGATLNEYYCVRLGASSFDYVQTEQYSCPNGCSNGACNSAAALAPAVVAMPASITVTSPNDGTEQWVRGSTHNITWTAVGLPSDARVLIKLTDHNGIGQSYYVTSSVSASSGIYAWTIGTSQIPLGDKFKIDIIYDQRVIMNYSKGSYAEDDSDNYFSIVAPGTLTPSSTPTPAVPKPYVKIMSPDGNETWKVGETHVITWQQSDDIKYVSAYAYFDPSGSGVQIYSGAVAAGNYKSFNWIIPPNQINGQPSANFKMYIYGFKDSDTTKGKEIALDYSNYPFSISAAPVSPANPAAQPASLKVNFTSPSSIPGVGASVTVNINGSSAASSVYTTSVYFIGGGTANGAPANVAANSTFTVTPREITGYTFRTAGTCSLASPGAVAGQNYVCSVTYSKSANVTSVCTPNWQYNAWSTCANSQQTRTVTDYNNCGVLTNKPATTQSCATSQFSGLNLPVNTGNPPPLGSNPFNSANPPAPSATPSPAPWGTITYLPGVPHDNTGIISPLNSNLPSLTLPSIPPTPTPYATTPTTPPPTPTPAVSQFSCYNFDNNLGYANSGSAEVGYLHAALQKEGISCYPDTGNVYGEATRNAVAAFQEKYASDILPANFPRSWEGSVGASTRAKLNALYGCDFSATIPNNPPIVSANTVTCTNFTYSAWSDCVNGTHARNIIAQTPANCVGGSPVLTESCTPVTVPWAPAFNPNLPTNIGAPVSPLGSNPFNSANPPAPAIATTCNTQHQCVVGGGGMACSTSANCASTQSAITVISPNGGEAFFTGSTQGITWRSDATASVPRVKIDLYKAGIFSQTIIASAAKFNGENGGAYRWNVPTTIPAGNDYKIRISKYDDASVYDESAENFSIATITVLSPNGEEVFTAGQNMDITWSGAEELTNIMIHIGFSKNITGNSAVTFDYQDVINSAGVLASPGKYTWTIPANMPAGNYKLVITGIGDPLKMGDVSDKFFKIVAPGTISAVTCTSFTYSAWSDCANGVQSRTVATRLPANCMGGNPFLTQSCANTLTVNIPAVPQGSGANVTINGVAASSFYSAPINLTTGDTFAVTAAEVSGYTSRTSGTCNLNNPGATAGQSYSCFISYAQNTAQTPPPVAAITTCNEQQQCVVGGGGMTCSANTDCNSSQPYITITLPTDKQSLVPGKTYQINWTTTSQILPSADLFIGLADIDAFESSQFSVKCPAYSYDGVNNYYLRQQMPNSTILSASCAGFKLSAKNTVKNTGSYSWTIPATMPPGSNYILFVSNPPMVKTVNITIANPAAICTETDSGMDYEKYGVTTLGGRKYLDVCDSAYTDQNTASGATTTVLNCSGPDCKLIEYYCDTASPTGLSHNSYACPNGCSKGACAKAGVVVGKPQVVFTSPSKGETWTAGETHNITWDAYGISANAYVHLSLINKNPGVNEIVAVPASQGSYSWTLPATIGAVAQSVVPGDAYIYASVPTPSGIWKDVPETVGTSAAFIVANPSYVAPTPSPTPAPGNGTCSDSDGGKSYDVLGTATYYNNSGTDRCADANTGWNCASPNSPKCVLIEYFCDNSLSNPLTAERHTCPNGCMDGACISSTQPFITLTSPSGNAPGYVGASGKSYIFWETPAYTQWVVGKAYTVTWTSKNIPINSEITINLKSMSSGKQIVLARSKTNDGKEAFVVPDLSASFPDWPSGNFDYAVTVSASSDVSGGPGMVSIVPLTQKAAIVLPNGGEKLTVGQTYRVTWTSSQTDKVYLYLDNNSGKTGSASTYITPGGAVAIPATQGYYDWTITSQQLQGMVNLDQSKYKIRIATRDYKVKVVPNDFTLFGTPVTTYTGYFSAPADKGSSGFFSISK